MQTAPLSRTLAMSPLPPLPADLPDTSLVLLVRAGNREAADLMVLRHMGLVLKVISRLGPLDASVDREDLVQAGLMAVHQCAATPPPRGWDPRHPDGAKFSTYCYPAICWAVRAARETAVPDDTTETDLVAWRESSGLRVVPDTREESEPPSWARDRACLALLLAALPPLHRAAIELCYGTDEVERIPLRQAARQLGISYRKLQTVLTQALRLMRQQMGLPAWCSTCRYQEAIPGTSQCQRCAAQRREQQSWLRASNPGGRAATGTRIVREAPVERTTPKPR